MVTISSLSLSLDFVLDWFPVCDCVFLHSQDIKLSAESQWQERISVDLFFSGLTFPLSTCLLRNSSASLIQLAVYWKAKSKTLVCLSTSVLFNFCCRITAWKNKERGLFLGLSVGYFFSGARGLRIEIFLTLFVLKCCMPWSNINWLKWR